MNLEPKQKAQNEMPDMQVSWHALSPEQVVQQLQTQLQEGLTSAEVKRRQEIVGLNQLAEKPRPSFLQLVLDQLKNFVVILLIVAALISGLLGEWIDAGAIFAIVVLNAILGVVQESRAEEALAALKKLAAPEAQVMRGWTAHQCACPRAGAGRYRLPGSRQLMSRPMCACWKRSTCGWKKLP